MKLLLPGQSAIVEMSAHGTPKAARRLAHQLEIGGADRLVLLVHRAATDVHDLGPGACSAGVGVVDHHFALSMQALMSAPSKNRFPKASWPILACGTLRSTVG